MTVGRASLQRVGTIIAGRAAGFEAYRDVEHAREELAIAPIIGEVVELDHAGRSVPRTETGGAK